MEEIKKEIIEKVILVAVADQDTTEAEESLDELEELVKTAGAEVVARVIQVEKHHIQELISEKVRSMKSMLCYTELMRQGSSVMTNYHQHRSAI